MATGSIFEQIIDPANRADPWSLYRELRKTPVTREADGTYVVSRYRDIVALLHDPRISATGGVALPGRLVNLDPPAHDRIRRTLMRHYGPPEAPGRIESMRAGLQDAVTGLIDRLAGQNQADLVDEFADMLPVTAICRLLGVPVEDEPRFHAWVDAIVANIRLQGTAAEHARRRRDDAFAEMDQYFAALADARREAPGEDLLSALVADDRTWAEVSREELLANVALLLFAGHETTVDLIANGIMTLLRHPGALKRVGSEPGFAVLAVEEVLRYEPVLHFLPNRLALDDIDVAGVTIPAGAPIRPALAAGNRDPDYVRDPDQFDPDRHNPECADVRPEESQHLSFGAGIHYCFGAPLARLETEIALTELARRLENPRLLADPPPYRPNPLLHGPAHLPVGFDRIRPARESGALWSDVALSPIRSWLAYPPTRTVSPGRRHADDSPDEGNVTALTAPSAAAKPAGAAPARLPAEPPPQPGQAFMSALVTEHFVLQSARSTTVSEAVGRAAVYLTCVSSSLVAFGFFAAATHRLAPVVATVLPALIILGVFTFVRLVETSVENLVFLRRIEAIRRYYVTLDPAAAAFFASADGEATTALASTGMRADVTEMFFTGASMVAAVTGILAGAGAALLLDAARMPVPAAVIAGVAAALLAFGLQMLWMYRRGQPAMA